MQTNVPGSTENPQPGSVLVSGQTADQFQVSIDADGHILRGDEPVSQGGGATGPSPYDFLSAALGSCTVMTLNMYARRKEMPLESVTVRVQHGKVHAKDCEDCETKTGMIDRLERHITLKGAVTAEQTQRLLEIADRCPVHRTLQSEIKIVTHLAS